MLSIVIPTITGREDTFTRVATAYADTTEGWHHEIVIVRDAKNWPAACNEGYRKAHGSIIHFGADDLEPLPGWWKQPLAHLNCCDELPAARVLNYYADGPMDNAGDGADGALTHFTRVPIMRRDQYERIGPWPEIDYCADVWLSEKARTVGIETRLLYSYAFVHYWCQIGRLDSPDRLQASEDALSKLRREMVAS